MILAADKSVLLTRVLAGCCLAALMLHAGLNRAETGVRTAADADLVRISADNMKYDMKTGISSYTGNVHITRNDMELSGDSVTVKQQGNEIEQLIVTGNPARYRQTADNGETIAAESHEMTYSTRQNQLILTDTARLEQAGHIVESQRIIYDTVQEVVIAGQIRPQDRVNITLTPKKETPEQPAPTLKPDAKGGR
jgi:lipopolysaccharide export system protein LptA